MGGEGEVGDYCVSGGGSGGRGGDGRLMCEWGRKWGERGRRETNV